MNEIKLEKHRVFLGEKVPGKQKSNVSPESMTKIALLVREEGGGASWAMRGSACTHVAFGTEAWGSLSLGSVSCTQNPVGCLSPLTFQNQSPIPDNAGMFLWLVDLCQQSKRPSHQQSKHYSTSQGSVTHILPLCS